MLIKHKRLETGTFARTAHQLARMGMVDHAGVSVAHWINPYDDEMLLFGSNSIVGDSRLPPPGALRSAVVDSLTDFQPALQAALNSGNRRLVLPSSELVCKSRLVLPLDGLTIVQEAGGLLSFPVENCAGIFAAGRTGLALTIDLFGAGVWSDTWNMPCLDRNGRPTWAATGRANPAYNSGSHEERGVWLRACRDVTVNGRVRNFGAAGLSAESCKTMRGSLRIEGTHRYGSPIKLLGSFAQGTGNRQAGAYLYHDVGGPYAGPCDDIDMDLTVTDVGQGVVSELNGGPHPAVGITLRVRTENIRGQHSIYNTVGNSHFTLHADKTNLAAVKIANGGTLPLENVTARVTGSDIGSSVFEVYALSSGPVRNLDLVASATRVGSGLGIGTGSMTTGGVQNVRAQLELDGVDRRDVPFPCPVPTPSSTAVQLQGGAVRDIQVDVVARNCRAGVLAIYGPTRSIRAKVTGRNVAQGADVIRIAHPDAQVTLVDPDMDGTGRWGIFCEQPAPKPITAIRRANPVVVTAAGHGRRSGDRVRIADVGGTAELSGVFMVAAASADSFALAGVDGRNFRPYTGGGIVDVSSEVRIVGKARVAGGTAAIRDDRRTIKAG